MDTNTTYVNNFNRLVRDITESVQNEMRNPGDPDPTRLRYQANALGALHESSEAYLIGRYHVLWTKLSTIYFLPME